MDYDQNPNERFPVISKLNENPLIDYSIQEFQKTQNRKAIFPNYKIYRINRPYFNQNDTIYTKQQIYPVQYRVPSFYVYTSDINFVKDIYDNERFY
jgi:hypothetical protein